MPPPLCGLPPYGDFKISPPLPLCSSKSHKYDYCDNAPYVVSSYPQPPQTNILGIFTCPQAELAPHLSLTHQQVYFKVHLLQESNL